MEKDIPKYDDIMPRYPGDFRIGEILLYSYGGSQLDISGLTTLINIYQDIDSAFVSGNIMFFDTCLLYTSPSPRDFVRSRMPSSA